MIEEIWMDRMKYRSVKKIMCAFAAVGMMTLLVLPAQAERVTVRQESQTASVASNGQPSLQSETGIVADADSGQIYFNKSMHVRMYPASITKILTGLVSVENAQPSDVVTVPQDVTQAEGSSVANIALTPGDTITVDQLEYTMFLASANDSAIAIADHVGGSISNFVSMMNTKASALGATDSHFSTPNGLPDPNNYTTAYDMTLITRAAVQNPTLMKYFSARTFTLPASALRKRALSFVTLHKMMKKTAYYDADVVAGKTGWETMSKNTLVTVARKNGRTLIAVVMDGTNSEAIYGDTRQLLNYAFAQPSNASAEKLVNSQPKAAIVQAVTDRSTQKSRTTSGTGQNMVPEIVAVTCMGVLICMLVAMICWRVRRRGFLD